MAMHDECTMLIIRLQVIQPLVVLLIVVVEQPGAALTVHSHRVVVCVSLIDSAHLPRIQKWVKKCNTYGASLKTVTISSISSVSSEL